MAASAQYYPPAPSFKILMIGDDAVGKSSLLAAYFERPLVYISSTIGVEVCTRHIKVGPGGERVKVQIWDSAGQERSRSIIQAVRGTKGVIVVYSVTEEKSFEEVKTVWMDMIKENAPANTAVMFLGNKCDTEKRRVVSEERGRMLAAEYGVMFMEVSAKTGHNVERAFLKLIGQIKFTDAMKYLSSECSLDPWNDAELLETEYQTHTTESAAEIEERAAVTLNVCDNSNQPCSLPTSAIQTRLVCGSTNEETPCVVTELDRGRYGIACQPTTPGLHTLEVKVHGRPVRGSPFAVRVKDLKSR